MKNFLIFRETEVIFKESSFILGSNFPSSKDKKNSLLNNFLYSRK